MLSDDNYIREEIVIDAKKANLYVVLLFIPALIVFGLPFYFRWHELFTLSFVRLYMQENVKWLKPAMPPMIFGSLIGGVILHELLHGITWACFARRGFRSIRFGFLWKVLTPYCHCNEPLSINAYRLGVAMPGVVLGFLPMFYGFLIGHIGVFVFGLFFTIAAGGDLLILFMLRSERNDCMIQDHPDKIGCYVYRERTAQAVSKKTKPESDHDSPR